MFNYYTTNLETDNSDGSNKILSSASSTMSGRCAYIREGLLIRPSSSYGSHIEYLTLDDIGFPGYNRVDMKSIKMSIAYNSYSVIVARDTLMAINRVRNDELTTKIELIYLDIDDMRHRTDQPIEGFKKTDVLAVNDIDKELFALIITISWTIHTCKASVSQNSCYLLVTVMANNIDSKGKKVKGCFQHRSWLYSWQSIRDMTDDRSIAGISPLSCISDVDVSIDDRDSTRYTEMVRHIAGGQQTAGHMGDGMASRLASHQDRGRRQRQTGHARQHRPPTPDVQVDGRPARRRHAI